MERSTSEVRISVLSAVINRILSVIRVVRVHRVDDLSEIIFGLRSLGLILHGAKSGEEQTDQDRNDRNDDEQLDERKGAEARLGVFCIAAGL